MRHAAIRFVPALVLSLCALVITTIVAAPGAAAARSAGQAEPTTGENDTTQGACQNRQLPPPPVDTSEEPKPGEPSPEPLPVPEDPVGGTRMGECGLVQPEGSEAPPTVTAATWAISDLDSGAVLAAKDPHARERPASLIKVLLAIVVIRELRPETVVTGTQEDANQEGTRVGIGPGGEYTVELLLDALVMRSGNDAAYALARALGGTEAALEKMNALAKELGALDTRAATPSGLDGPGMMTSAYDQSLIFRAAMQHEEFAKAAKTPRIDFPGYGGRPGFQVNNDNRLLGEYEGFLGGKTGFTDDARHTYVGAAERDGRRLAVVLLRGEREQEPLAQQGAALLDYGFALAAADAEPVGELVTQSPDVQPKPNPNQRSEPTESGSADKPAENKSTEAETDRSAFGNVGLPLVILAGLAVLVTLAMWLRRRRARAARAAR
ncbi:D-alanyl-D-alanine carboxypeptidase family protein [Actinophytocola sp. NPDC049390]|uniref:D-alanyl-D-alanine carboxypeptidase family protein n=1 Tax=Actinophytocola sp. NPDC049390 TaxID=3363894 RepID=UPI00379D5C2D